MYLMTRRLEAIDVDECLQLLASRYVGRVAFIEDGRPQVLPVNYAMFEGSIVFRTDYGALLEAVHLSEVAFEVDAIDSDYHTGWSIVVRGRAEEAWRPEDLSRLRELPLRPWAPGARDHYVRIDPTSMTGRRIS